jgi:hypothetical protein
MPRIDSKTRRTAGAALVVLLASLALAACGSSSSTASNTTSTQAGPASGNRAAFAGRFKALRECLQKNGVTLPNRTPGQGAGGGARGLLGAPAGSPPAGVSKSTYEAALKKCGGSAPGRANSPAFKQAATKFAACMSENGVKLPAPNTSGTGPVFNTRGLDTTSATFKAAQSKCSSLLRGSVPGAPAA